MGEVGDRSCCMGGLRPCYSVLSWGLCTFCMSSLFNKPDSDHQLVSREIHELKSVCQI